MPGEVDLLLAAHGSGRSDAPAAVAVAMADLIARQTGIGRVQAGFIDQPPRIAQVAAGLRHGAICLPFFAARGGHVTDDLPAALAEGGFRGSVLDPVGLHPAVPQVIAAALRSRVGAAPVTG